MRHNIYLTKETEDTLNLIFEYLKARGDLPANAPAIGPYRAQVLTVCVNYMIDMLDRRIEQEEQRQNQNTGGQRGT